MPAPTFRARSIRYPAGSRTHIIASRNFPDPEYHKAVMRLVRMRTEWLERQRSPEKSVPWPEKRIIPPDSSNDLNADRRPISVEIYSNYRS